MSDPASPDNRGKRAMLIDPNRYDPTLDAKLALLADVHCRLIQDISAFTENFQHALCELGRMFETDFRVLVQLRPLKPPFKQCKIVPWWPLPVRLLQTHPITLHVSAHWKPNYAGWWRCTPKRPHPYRPICFRPRMTRRTISPLVTDRSVCMFMSAFHLLFFLLDRYTGRWLLYARCL